MQDTNFPAGRAVTTRRRSGSLNTRTTTRAGAVGHLDLEWDPIGFLLLVTVSLRETPWDLVLQSHLKSLKLKLIVKSALAGVSQWIEC